MDYIHQTHILRRLIRLRGQAAEIYRLKKNEFHEPDGTESLGNIGGLFHEASGYLGAMIVEAGKTYTAKQPMFLCEYTEKIQKEDILEMQGIRYRVTGLDDLGNLHVFLDISLEVA